MRRSAVCVVGEGWVGDWFMHDDKHAFACMGGSFGLWKEELWV